MAKKLFIFSLLLTLCSRTATYAFDFVDGQLAFTITSEEDMTVEIETVPMKTLLSITNINYPSETVTYGTKTYTITSVADSCFAKMTSLEKVVLPGSLTSMGKGAFYECTKLTSVTLPSSGCLLSNGCFAYCSSLASITIPTDIYSLGDDCFKECASLTSVTIPAIRRLGKNCFQGCTSLTTVTIASGIGGLSDSCFEGCNSLTSITVPTGVSFLGKDCFYGCEKLEKVTLPTSVTRLQDRCFADCFKLSKISIPANVTSLGEMCFAGCTSLQAINIPQKVKSLGNGCFQYCTSLTTVSGMGGLTALPDMCFYECSELTGFTVPSGVTSLGNSCFLGCSKLASVFLPEGLSSLGVECFEGCTGLTTINMRKGLTSIGAACFLGCSNLACVVMPSAFGLTVGEDAFRGCDNITDIYYPNYGTGSGATEVFSYRKISSSASGAYASREDYEPIQMIHTPATQDMTFFTLDSYINDFNVPDKFFGTNRLWPDADCIEEMNNNLTSIDIASIPALRHDCPEANTVIPITDNEWHTLCLPIDWTPDENVYGDYKLLGLYKVIRNTDDNSIKFVFKEGINREVVAWYPYLFKAGDSFVYNEATAPKILDFDLQSGSEKAITIKAELVGSNKETKEWTYYWVGNCEGLYHKSGEKSSAFSLDRPRYAYYLGKQGGETSFFYQKTSEQRVWAPYTASILAYCEDYQTDETPGITVNDDFRNEVGTMNAKSIITCVEENGETTVINELSTTAAQQRTGKDIYDLTGRKVGSADNGTAQLPAGIYISNGKKIFVK